MTIILTVRLQPPAGANSKETKLIYTWFRFVSRYNKPIYLDLIKESELKKCLQGKTQNQNESFNSMIWERAHKTTYCSFDKLEFAVYDAVANFNDGRQASIDILEHLNIRSGYHTATMCFMLNKRRKYLAVCKSKDSMKKARKIIRAERKNKGVKQNKNEGTV